MILTFEFSLQRVTLRNTYGRNRSVVGHREMGDESPIGGMHI